MAAETGTDSIVNLSPEERRLFGQLFRQADYDNVSVVTGEIAVSFFEKTRLDTRVLGQVSDTETLLTPSPWQGHRPHLPGRC
ncbi:hypothetical protein IMZ48_03905, partial [Candidatus Bathyarchaeota archaeon]|nr:hypothetical protein [Candidatus Bathyarchaeota archaeon]